MEIREIKGRLYNLSDKKYAEFSAKLIPGHTKEYFIGVPTPKIKAYTKEILRAEKHKKFLTTLPHDTFEENLLHAFIIANEKLPIDTIIEQTEAFLPHINNWAVCDQFSVKLFGKHHETIYPYLKKWMESKHTYTRRFAIVNSMRFFLDEKFEPHMPNDVAAATTDDYYIRMAVAWYFATALAKQWEAAVPFIEQRQLSEEVHRMTIRKALDSFRISEEHKAYIKGMR